MKLSLTRPPLGSQRQSFAGALEKLGKRRFVGRNFGAYMTHEANHHVYFYFWQMAVLLFKTG